MVRTRAKKNGGAQRGGAPAIRRSEMTANGLGQAGCGSGRNCCSSVGNSSDTVGWI